MLINLLIFVLILGFIYWLVTAIIPMPEPYSTVVKVIFGLILLFAVLSALGVTSRFGVNIPHFV